MNIDFLLNDRGIEASIKLMANDHPVKERRQQSNSLLKEELFKQLMRKMQEEVPQEIDRQNFKNKKFIKVPPLGERVENICDEISRLHLGLEGNVKVYNEKLKEVYFRDLGQGKKIKGKGKKKMNLQQEIALNGAMESLSKIEISLSKILKENNLTSPWEKQNLEAEEASRKLISSLPQKKVKEVKVKKDLTFKMMEEIAYQPSDIDSEEEKEDVFIKGISPKQILKKQVIIRPLPENYFYHRHVSRWETKDFEEIKTYSKVSSLGNKFYPYAKLSDEEILLQKQKHYFPGVVENILALPDVRDLYCSPTDSGYSLKAEFITQEEEVQAGYLHFGIDPETKIIYHCFFKSSEDELAEDSEVFPVEFQEERGLWEVEKNTRSRTNYELYENVEPPYFLFKYPENGGHQIRIYPKTNL